MQAQGWNCESNFWKLGNRILYRILLGLSRGVEMSKTRDMAKSFQRLQQVSEPFKTATHFIFHKILKDMIR